MSLSTDERENTILIDPCVEGRDTLSKLLREGLKQRNELDQDGLNFTKLDKLDLTKVSQQDVLNYSNGQVIKFLRQYKSKNVDKNSYWTVVSRDIERNTLLLKDQSGQN